MLPLMDSEEVCSTHMIVTPAAFEVWHIHMLTLDVGPQHLCGAETLLANRTNCIALSHSGKDSNGRASLVHLTCVNSQPRQNFVLCCSSKSCTNASLADSWMAGARPCLLGIS